MIGKNNPFNIRYVKGTKWNGCIGETRGFCDFVSSEFGIRAACILIMRSYRMKGVLTIADIINRYAPKFENNTDRYVNFVCDYMSCFPFDIPSRKDFPSLLCAMSVFEGNPVSYDEINSVIDEFNIKPYKCK